MTGQTGPTNETFRDEFFDGEGAQRLLAAFAAEITALYPTWTPDIGPSARAEDFHPPVGRFLVAYLDEAPIACGGLKRLDAEAAEIKRLYVRPDMRNRGLGRRMSTGWNEKRAPRATPWCGLTPVPSSRRPSASSPLPGTGRYLI